MGGKYPRLYFMIDLLLELEPESRFIHIDRPIEKSIRSLMDRSTEASDWLRATPEQCERLQRALWKAKTEGLARVPEGRVLTLAYDDLLANPNWEVLPISRGLALPAQEEQMNRAESPPRCPLG